MNTFFGTQIRWALAVVEAKLRPVDAGVDTAKKRIDHARESTRLVMQIVVSAFALVLTSYLLVSGSNETVQKFAIGTIGTVIGYWLR
jgi:hypothetical protein